MQRNEGRDILVMPCRCDCGRPRWRQQDDCGSCFETYGIEAKVKSLLARKCGGEHAPESLGQRLRIQLTQTTIVTRVDPGQ